MVKIIFGLILVLLIGLSLYYFFVRGYGSAFEADQACHYALRQAKEVNLGCDHDIETNQWILYQSGLNNEPANVISRYRY